MASDDEDLRLNTLHRFAKRSPRLMLQEYGHCEVPAGCGGVVLRWLDPAEGIPAVIRVASLGRAKTSLDGGEEPFGHVTLREGRHVVSVHCTDVGKAWWSKGTAPILPSPFSLGVVSDAEGEERDLLASALDVRWRWTADSPAEDWRSLDFDDSGWAELEEGARFVEAIPADNRWGFDDAIARAQPIHAVVKHEAFVRVSFTLVRRGGRP